METHYNKSDLFKYAWRIFKANKSILSFSQCLIKAWFLAKTNPMGLKPITFESIFSSKKSLVENYINKRVNNMSISKDLAIDVFVKVSQHLNEFDSDISKLNTWLYNISKNIVIDYMRKTKRKIISINNYDVRETETSYRLKNDIRHIEDYVNDEGENYFSGKSDSVTDSDIEANDLQLLINNTINKFNDNQQNVCKLHLQGYKSIDISNQLNVPENTVKCYVRRFREVMQAKLVKVETY